MDKEQIKSEYEQLCKQAEQHNFNYYVLDDPTIEDDEYDRLMRRIKEIEAENPEIVSESSPTQHVGGYAINTFEKVTHEVQMGSLQDVFSKGELYEFDERVKKAVGKAYLFHLNTRTEYSQEALHEATALWARTSLKI